MNKNLILVQNGYPHSTTSGKEVDSLDITNFFKFEKDVAPSEFSTLYHWTSLDKLRPFVGTLSFAHNNYSDNEYQKAAMPTAWYEKEGELKYNKTFKHYSMTFLLFAVRMQKGFLGTDVMITSRLADDSPLKLKFYDIGEDLQSFQNMKTFIKYRSSSGDYANIHPHGILKNALSIPTLNQYNHCFLAALFSDSAYLKESGTKLLNNEPLLNISWTETAFTTEG